MTRQASRLRNSKGECTRATTNDLVIHRFARDETRNNRIDILPGSLPRVLYAIKMDPTRKLGSLEEEIIYLARAFKSHGSLFCPLFICREEVGEVTPFDALGIESECLDLRTFSWSQLLRLSQLISRHKISLVHWNFTEMLGNGYLW